MFLAVVACFSLALSSTKLREAPRIRGTLTLIGLHRGCVRLLPIARSGGHRHHQPFISPIRPPGRWGGGTALNSRYGSKRLLAPSLPYKSLKNQDCIRILDRTIRTPANCGCSNAKAAPATASWGGRGRSKHSLLRNPLGGRLNAKPARGDERRRSVARLEGGRGRTKTSDSLKLPRPQFLSET